MNIFKRQDGVEVEAERWGWGVIYFATPEQAKEAEIEEMERNKGLVIERNQAMVAARKANATKEAIESIVCDYQLKMAQRIEPERYELHQFDANGIFHNIAEIDWSRVQHFIMRPVLVLEGKEPAQMICIETKPDMQIFHVYKRFKLATGYGTHREVMIYCFGWKNKRTGSAIYNYILPDDRIITSSEDIDLTRYGI